MEKHLGTIHKKATNLPLGEEANVVHGHAHVEQSIERKEATSERAGEAGTKITKKTVGDTDKQNERNRKSHGMNDNSGKKSNLKTGGFDRPNPKERIRDNTMEVEVEVDGNQEKKDTRQASGGTLTKEAPHKSTSAGAQNDKNGNSKAIPAMQGLNKNGAGNRSPLGNK
ncbi:unnamed protein product [Linum trigynum]|uniref:Uncharacterized protein n=1 Tax=Linum trigynum TaxID=586398 RepID=A0AAV2DH00_9ROSI